MQQITHVEPVTIAPAIEAVSAVPSAKAVSTVKAGARLAYVDAIRLVLTILVIVVHAACTYNSLNAWTYRDGTQPIDGISDILLILFVMVCQSFFMGLFFFFAGYFTPGSYDRKGPAGFWKDRLLRIAIPMALYTWFLSRIPNYIDDVANEGVTLSFWQYSMHTMITDADAGPTWFLFVLLAFSLGYTLWRLASRWLGLRFAWINRLPAPGTKMLLAIGLVFSAAMFAVAQVWSILDGYEAWNTITLMLAFFPAYIILFVGGALACRNQWLLQMPARMLRFWGPFSAALVIALPVLLMLGGAIDGDAEVFFRGFTWQCAAMCLWLGFSCISLSTTLTLWMRERTLPQSKIAAYAGRNNFTVYLIHPLVLVPLTLGLSLTALPVMVKFGIASLVTVPLCYLLADGLRRLPGARAIL